MAKDGFDTWAAEQGFPRTSASGAIIPEDAIGACAICDDFLYEDDDTDGLGRYGALVHTACKRGATR